ncbi:MAG TPA: glucosidase [Mycobacteriales bacterium]|nr:glucosidase [Mycobacteriales bacterium]
MGQGKGGPPRRRSARASEPIAESRRLAEADAGTAPWRAWGPYLAERAWGTVREDYSADGDAWSYFPYEHARSRAYRWNEDGLGGLCDVDQSFCLSFAFWNGNDRELKERAFGLTNGEGNHGEDVKDYWWFLDSTPTHSWMRWRYHYPQAAFPYNELRSVNASLGRDDPEWELVDSGVFDEHRYFVVDVDYAKADPTDYCIRLTVTNRGPDPARLDVLPTLWFRNTWAWGPATVPPPELRGDGPRLVGDHHRLGRLVLAGDGDPTPLLCDNETNSELLDGHAGRSRYPKDGIGDHVVAGTSTVNPDQVGTKGSLWYRFELAAGETREIRLRLTLDDAPSDLGAGWAQVLTDRRREADEFYAGLLPADASTDEELIVRQAIAGLLWSKQFYPYDVERWLSGDPSAAPPPQSRLDGRNNGWPHVNAHEIILMPDTWEYPWFAAWDLAFHATVAAHVDPALAKEQLLLLCREWYMHPDGQLPAYEWNFSDVNPPVHAWAALRVFHTDGGRDYDFLERMFHKLMINFTWWVNRKDVEGNNLFQGGFLGLDNIGPFDRSMLPVAGHLEQSDGTAWMAMFCLEMLEMALELAIQDPTYSDVATKFFEHYCYIATALDQAGLWDEEDGFYYDVLHTPDGESVALRARSMVGLIPVCAVLALHDEHLAALPDFAARMHWFLTHKAHLCAGAQFGERSQGGRRLLAVVDPDRLARLLARLFDESEFLSDHGLRALSAYHRDHPLLMVVEGLTATVDYEPAESRSGLFGGNSNWRGPVWFPLNYLLIRALRRFALYSADSATVELPTGSGRTVTLSVAAEDLTRRLIGIFCNDQAGRRPVFGTTELFQSDADWHDLLPFHEYFHGDTGAGLGAAHQTGWTALVAALILDRKLATPPGPGQSRPLHST